MNDNKSGRPAAAPLVNNAVSGGGGIWDSKDNATRQSLWDEKPAQQPAPAINKPKTSLWDEKPMEFKGPAGGAANNFNIPSLNDNNTNVPVSQLK